MAEPFFWETPPIPAFGVGDEGLVAVGVESAVPLIAVFLVFFLRPMMGACSGCSAMAGTGASWALEASSFNLARACLSFFCWLFDTCLTGADPILTGGGVFAREIEAEVNDALSDILSLIGVPGTCTDARLPLREGCLFAAEGGAAAGASGSGGGGGTLTLDGEADGTREGGSATGVETTRSVRDWG